MSAPRKEPTDGEVAGAIAADLFVPISVFYGTVGSLTQFKAWKKKGLQVRRFNNRPCVRPSELRAFQEKHAGEAWEGNTDE